MLDNLLVYPDRQCISGQIMTYRISSISTSGQIMLDNLLVYPDRSLSTVDHLQQIPMSADMKRYAGSVSIEYRCTPGNTC